VPENTLKFAVGLMLSTFGVFWLVEGLGVFAQPRTSLEFPGGDVALLVLLAVWFAVARILVRILRAGRAAPRGVAA
jgi:uncharacterized membrane protein